MLKNRRKRTNWEQSNVRNLFDLKGASVKKTFPLESNYFLVYVFEFYDLFCYFKSIKYLYYKSEKERSLTVSVQDNTNTYEHSLKII